MDCWSVRSKISAFLDGALADGERREIREHRAACNSCSREIERFERVRTALLTLPKAGVPPELTARLRVTASRVLSRSSAAESGWPKWRDRLELAAKNLMRPLALPLAGGVCSAIVLFSALVPTFNSTFAMNKSHSAIDVPTMLATEPMVKYTAPVAFPETDVVLDLTIDDQGQVVNYTIVSAAPGQRLDQLRPIIENKLLFTGFWPATAFGRPVAGTVRVSFGSAHVDVRD